MKRQKTISRKKAPPFKKALRAARAVLHTKLQEREACVRILKELNVEIPNLERTCRALEAQLNGTVDTLERSKQQPSKPVTSKLHLSEVGTFTKEQINEMFPGANGDEIPPEIRAQLPSEDLSKFGSHYGENPTPSEDLLPEIDGKPLVPEK